MEVEEIRFKAVKAMDEAGYYRLVYEGPKPESKEDSWAITLPKWEFVVRWYSNHSEPLYCGATKTCGLCMMYQSSFCDGCPIRRKTTLSGCAGTPWIEYHSLLDDMDASKMQAAARAELEFLRGVKAEEEEGE